MTKNSCERSLLSQPSIFQAAPGRLSADTPVSSRNDELQEDGRALWLAPGEASGVWIHLYQSKATEAESLHGRGACGSCGRWSSHSGHCRRHKPWHGNTVPRPAPAWGTNPQLSQLLRQMKTSQLTGIMSASAHEFSPLSPYRSQMPTSSPVGLCQVAPSLLQPWTPEQVPRGHTQSPG